MIQNTADIRWIFSARIPFPKFEPKSRCERGFSPDSDQDARTVTTKLIAHGLTVHLGFAKKGNYAGSKSKEIGIGCRWEPRRSLCTCYSSSLPQMQISFSLVTLSKKTPHFLDGFTTIKNEAWNCRWMIVEWREWMKVTWRCWMDMLNEWKWKTEWIWD